MPGSFFCPRCRGPMAETHLVCSACVREAQRRVAGLVAPAEADVPPPVFESGTLRAALTKEAERLRR